MSRSFWKFWMILFFNILPACTIIIRSPNVIVLSGRCKSTFSCNYIQTILIRNKPCTRSSDPFSIIWSLNPIYTIFTRPYISNKLSIKKFTIITSTSYKHFTIMNNSSKSCSSSPRSLFYDFSPSRTFITTLPDIIVECCKCLTSHNIHTII